MNVKETVYEVIASKFALDVNDMKDEDHLESDYGSQSHDIIQMSAMLQQKADVKLSYVESNSCNTVGDWVNLVQSKVDAK